MILYFIVGMAIIYISIEFPSVILLALAILAITHISKDKRFFPSEEPADSEPDAKKRAREEDGFEIDKDRQERYKDNGGKTFKKDFVDDEEWKKQAAKLKTTRELARQMADEELIVDLLKEAEQCAAAGEWSKVHAIQASVAKLEAK